MTDFAWETDAPVPFRAALEQIEESIQPLGRERIPIERGLGRIAARDLVAPIDVPSHPVSNRDGFALRAADTQDAGLIQPCQIRVVEHAFPETPPADLAPLAPGEAVPVSTGAPLPPRADAVVPTEKAPQKGAWILLSAPVRSGAGVLLPGSDVREGTPIVSAGSSLNPLRLGLLATTGLERLEVFQVPRVAIIATGSEFRHETDDPADDREEPRSVLPGNVITLAAWCTRFNLPVGQWVGHDTREELSAALEEAIAACDAIVTIGSTGHGQHDFVRATLTELGWKPLISGVRLRPGGTSSFGFLRGKPTFALPERPTASETAFLLLALPGIMRLAGTKGEPFPEIPARLARDLKRSTDQRRWTQAVKVRLYPNDYFLHALPLVGRIVQRERGRMQVAAAGHGILLLEEGEAGLRAGDVFPVLLLESSWV